MKSTTLNRIAVLTGLTLGAFALSVAAANFSAPLHTPPTCNTGEPGCDAPINVGPTLQTKLGWVGLKGLITNDLTFSKGTPTANQSVLMAMDSTGTIGWGIPGGGGGGNTVQLSSVFSAESQSTNSSGGLQGHITTIFVGTPSQWSACFLTQSRPISTTSGLNARGTNGSCYVTKDGGGNWLLKASVPAEDEANVHCESQCLKI